MFDMILLSVAGVFQLFVIWYTVDIAVRENRVRNAIVIGLVGLAAVGLTGWAAYDAYVSQDRLNAEIASIKKQLSGAQVALVRMGLTPPIQQLDSNKPIEIEMMFGVDEGTAKSMQCWFGAFTLPGDANSEQNRIAVSKFRKAIANEDPPAGEDRITGSGCRRQLLVKVHESEITEMIEAKDGSVKRILYAMGRVQWKNEGGADFHTEVCKWMEPPKGTIMNSPGWHDCSD